MPRFNLDPRFRKLLSHGGVTYTLRIGLGLAAGFAFIVLLVRHIDFAVVGSILSQATIGPMLLALAACAADFILRAVRYWVMLVAATGRPLPFRPCVAPFIASFGLSDILPLRAGDGFRIIWFNRKLGIPAGTLIGTMLVERALDLATLLMLGGVALAMVGLSAPPAFLSGFPYIPAVVLLAGLVVASLLIVRVLEQLPYRFAAGPATRLLGVMRSMLAAVRQMGNWRRLIVLTLYSLACWILESMIFVFAWLSLGETMEEMAKPLLAFVSSTLGTLVPGLPGHFGSFEYFGVQAFSLVGVDPSFGAAVVILAHLVLWGPTAMFAVGWMLMGSARAAPRADARLQP